MGMQVPYSMDTEVSEKIDLRTIAKVSWINVKGTRSPEREQDIRGSSSARSCSHVDIDTTEVCGIPSGRFHKREKRHPDSKKLCWTSQEFYGAKFLGPEAIMFQPLA